MKLLKVGAIVNIVFGAIVFIATLVIGIFGTLMETNNLDGLKNLLPDSVQADFQNFVNILNEGNKERIVEYLMQHNSPAFVIHLLSNNTVPVLLMGIGYGIASYVLVVQFILTGILVDRIVKANRGNGAKVSRTLIIITSILSLLPIAFPGIIMLMGSFVKQPGNRRPAPQQRRSYY